ncbi:MAG: phytoene desaturase family protein [Promethearchaeota archaeon]
MSENFKYIIIGGGISGMHIGALLSQHGKTLILEKAKEIGGRARVTDIDGFKLDLGAHPIRFGPDSALAKSLNEIGKPQEFLKPGTFWAFLDDGTKTIFPAGGLKQVKKSKMVPTLKALGLIIQIKKKMELPKDFEALYDISLKDWMDKEGLIPELKRYLIMTSSAVQVNPFPERSSAGELLHNIRRILDIGSIYYPRGGWGAIFSKFEEKIKENGEIKTEKEVNEIVIENKKAVGVKVGEELIRGETIVSTIPIQQLFTILDEKLCSEEFVNKCKLLRPTAGISIDFCLDKPITDIDFFFFEKPLAFGWVPSNLSPEIVPQGKSIMSFFSAKNVEDIKNKKRSKELHQELRNTIIRFFPEIEENVLHERPLFFEMVDGVEVNIEQHRLKRPGNQVEDIKNLWITGDSCGGEGAGGDVGHTSVRECYEKTLKS